MRAVDQLDRAGQRNLSRFEGQDLDAIRRKNDAWSEFRVKRQNLEADLSAVKRAPASGRNSRDVTNRGAQGETIGENQLDNSVQTPRDGAGDPTVGGNRRGNVGGKSGANAGVNARNRVRDNAGQNLSGGVAGTDALSAPGGLGSLKLPENLRSPKTSRNVRSGGESGVASGNLSRQRRPENAANLDATRVGPRSIERNLQRIPADRNPGSRINRDLVSEPDDLGERARQRVEQWNRQQMNANLDAQRQRSLGNERIYNPDVPRNNRGRSIDGYQPIVPDNGDPRLRMPSRES